MSRKQAKTIDQIEAVEQPSIFTDKRKEAKEFEVVREPSGLYRIKYSAGGEVPDTLKGRFTTIARAQAAIDNEMVLRKQKEQTIAG